MLEYVFVLFIIILMIAIIYRFFLKHYIPVRQEIFYGILGMSFFLGAIFPLVLSVFSPGQIIIIYLGLLVFSGSALSYANNRFYFSVINAPVKIIDLEKNEAQAKQLLEPFETILQKEILMIQNNESSQNLLNEQETEVSIGSFTVNGASPVEYSGECTNPHSLTTAAKQDISEEGAVVVTVTEEIATDDIADTKEIPITKEAAVTKETEDFLLKTPSIKEIQFADEYFDLQDKDTVNHCISSAFKAKTRGDMAEALTYFYKGLRLSHGKKIKSALALEISTAYQELGQYTQAGMILRSVLDQESIVSDSSLRQILLSQLVYLETLAELTIKAGMPNVPYSKMPNLIKLKANVDFNKKLENLQSDAHLN